MTPYIKAVAWDIDGTLIDSEPLHDEVLVTVCADCGADLSDLPANNFRGKHLKDVWLALAPRFFSHITQDEWYDRLVQSYIKQKDRLPRWHEALDVVKQLAEHGIRQVCVSNSGRAVVDTNLSVIGIGDIIEFSISIDDVTKGKPDPMPYALAAERLGLAACEIAAVEDSATGARSAHLAGMQVFGFKGAGYPDVPLAITNVERHAELLDFFIPAARQNMAEERRYAHGL